jgi:hypothetical protein
MHYNVCSFINSSDVFYLNDILIFIQMWGDPVSHLQQALDASTMNKRMFKNQKCDFATSLVSLGKVIGGGQLSIDLFKVAKTICCDQNKELRKGCPIVEDVHGIISSIASALPSITTSVKNFQWGKISKYLGHFKPKNAQCSNVSFD